MEELEPVGSTVTPKYQATIPLAVRRFLGIEKGDRVVFEQVAGQIVIRKAPRADEAFTLALESTLAEWRSREDEEAYLGL